MYFNHDMNLRCLTWRSGKLILVHLTRNRWMHVTQSKAPVVTARKKFYRGLPYCLVPGTGSSIFNNQTKIGLLTYVKTITSII